MRTSIFDAPLPAGGVRLAVRRKGYAARPPSDGMSSLHASKSTLFCWRCDHEGPIDDWSDRERSDRLVHECPACGTAVTVRGSLLEP